jgi:hypothetical protein
MRYSRLPFDRSSGVGSSPIAASAGSDIDPSPVHRAGWELDIRSVRLSKTRSSPGGCAIGFPSGLVRKKELGQRPVENNLSKRKQL